MESNQILNPNKKLFLKTQTEISNKSSKTISKYAPSESSNSEKENIDEYFNNNKSKSNPYIIPQYQRMILLQQRLRALEDENNINNRKILQIMEQEYKNRIKYPKYTIIQNTPLTSREEIINQILKNKLGPNFVHSTNFPISTYKNDIEINELIATTGAELLKEKEQKEKDENKRKKLYDDSSSIYNTNNNNNNTINNMNYQTLLDMQKQNFELRNDYQKMFEGMKNMKNELENKMENVLNKQKITIENLRNIIERGGNNKLKASMYKILENKDINLDEISDEEREFKEVELPKIIQEKIDENEKKKYNYYQSNENENEIVSQRKNELPPINPFLNRDKFDSKSKITKKLDKKKKKKKLDDISDEEESESEDDKTKKKKKKKKNKKKKKKKDKKDDNENEEEEIEEEEDEDDDKTKKTKKKKKKNKKKNKKNKKKKEEEKKKQEEEYEFSDRSIDIKTDKDNEEQLGYVPIQDLLEDWD